LTNGNFESYVTIYCASVYGVETDRMEVDIALAGGTQSAEM